MKAAVMHAVGEPMRLEEMRLADPLAGVRTLLEKTA